MISADVVILTKSQFEARLEEYFQKGVKRGRFEEYSDLNKAGRLKPNA